MALDPGNVVQNAIYLSGGTEWPIGFDAWEARAREALEQTAYDYVAGGAARRRRCGPTSKPSGGGRSGRACLSAPRSATSPSRCSVSTRRRRSSSRRSVSSRSSTPTRSARSRAPRRSTGVPLVLSSAASTSLEDVAAIDPPRWFQLYWWGDRELAESLVRRAEAAGYGAIVVTVDTLTLGWRPRDLRNGYLPFLKGEGFAQFFQRPGLPSTARVATRGGPRHRAPADASRRSRTSRSPGTTSRGCVGGRRCRSC